MRALPSPPNTCDRSGVEVPLVQDERLDRGESKPVAQLPVRLSDTATKQVELEFGGGPRLRFEEGCDPAYVAAVVCRLR